MSKFHSFEGGWGGAERLGIGVALFAGVVAVGAAVGKRLFKSSSKTKVKTKE